ncbi:MAG TPA: ABC transporter permease [Candidatus Limnocylindrales bacterium]|nr:ABC transporter permease [Candidatus Limnocylindrales bacterium]
MGSAYLVRRLASAAITILLIVLINFLLFRAMPGSPERIILRGVPNVTLERLEATRERWGLNEPLFPDQFVSFLQATASGDLGFSFVARGQTVGEVLAQRIWPTLILFGLGELVAIVVGLALGAYSGWRRGGPIDFVGNGVSLILYSAPYFLLGMILLLIFATNLGWFPTFGMLTAGATYSSPVDRLVDFLSHLALPLATVALGLIGQYAIVMRSSIIETSSDDYVTTARGMGLKDSRVLRHHALPNAMLPTVTLVAINLGYVVAGAITVEVVFNWPGLGTLTVEALTARDYPVLQGVFLLLSVSVVLANLAADMVYGVLDPRVRT